MPELRLSWNARPLRTLEAIARLGSVSAAAAELGYTQSAASQQLATLEREAGVTLIERGTRPLRPTEAGGAVLAHARSILAGFVSMEAALADIHGLAAGRLRVAGFASALATFMPPAAARFASAHPGVSVALSVADPSRAVDALRAGAVDLAVVHRDAAGGEPEVPGLRRVPLFADRLRAVLPRAHPLAAHAELRLADLGATPLLLPSHERGGGGHRRAMESLLRGAGVEPLVAHEVDDLRAAQAMVAAGLGVSLMHQMTLPEPPLPGLAVRGIADAGAGARWADATTLAGRRMPAAEAFTAVLREEAERSAARVCSSPEA